jgi:hypothetical protein
MAMLLAQPAAPLPVRRSRETSRTTINERAASALAALAHLHGNGTTGQLSLAVCVHCPASQALVRVLARRHAAATPLPALLILTDQRWPALDSLARHTRSTIVTLPELASRVGATPAALRTGSHTAAIGTPAALTLIAATSPPLP